MSATVPRWDVRALFGGSAPSRWGRALHAYTAIGSVAYAIAFSHVVATWGDAPLGWRVSSFELYVEEVLDLHVWMVVGVTLSWVVAGLAIFGRTLTSFLAVLLVLLCFGYSEATPETMAGMFRLTYLVDDAALFALAIHAPVLLASLRWDWRATISLLAIVTAIGLALPYAWATRLRPESICAFSGAGVRHSLWLAACDVVQDRWEARGAEAARRDLDAGVHRLMSGGLPGPDSALAEAYAWDRYRVDFHPIFGCTSTPAQEAYIAGYDSVARETVLSRLPEWHELVREARALGGDRDPRAVRSSASLPPLEPAPPEL